MRKFVLGFCSIILFLSLFSFTVKVEAQASSGDISFQPNITLSSDDYNLTYLENGLFRLRWAKDWDLENYTKSVDIQIFVSHKEPDELKNVEKLVENQITVKHVLKKNPKGKGILFGATISGVKLTLFKYTGFILFNPINASLEGVEISETLTILEGNNVYIDFFDIFSKFKVVLKKYANYVVATVEVEKRDLMDLDPIVSDFTTIDTCDVASSWNYPNATQPTNDTITKKEGTGAMNLGKNQTSSVDFSYNKTISSTNINGKVIVVWIFVGNQSVLDNLNWTQSGIYLYQNAAWGFWRFRKGIDIVNLTLGWNNINFYVKGYVPFPPPGTAGNWDEGSGNPAMTGVNKIELYFETDDVTDVIILGDVKMDYWHYGTKITMESGGSAGSPLSLEDIYDADISNAWGLAEKINGEYVFYCPYYYIGDATDFHYFVEEDTSIVFNTYSGGLYLKGWSLYEYGGVTRFGALLDAENKITDLGCRIKIKSEYSYTIDQALYAEAQFYAGQFIGSTSSRYLFGDNVTFYNCAFNDFYIMSTTDVPLYIDRMTMENNEYYGMFTVSATGSMNDIVISNVTSAFALFSNPSPIVSNVKVRDITYLFENPSPYSGTFHFVDSDSDSYTFDLSGTGQFNREYTFDLTFTFDNGSYAEGTNVTVSNSYLGTSDSWILTANGSIPEQTYSMGHYNQTGGNTIYDYNPYNITATLDGYQTYSQLLNITQKEDLTIALQPKTGFTTGFGTGFIIALMIGLIFVLAGIAVKTKKGN